MEYKESFNLYKPKELSEQRRFTHIPENEDKAFEYSTQIAKNLFEDKAHKEIYQITAGFLAYKLLKEFLK